MRFETEFFQTEEREGFVIESMMKHAWAAELKVLTFVDELCEENGISYFADWGTLLGAVRHQGFIPWDDDIDICMKREDFYRFAQVMGEGHEELVLHSIFHDENWGAHAAHVATKHLMLTERKRLKEWYGFPFQAGIDIFIIDEVPQEESLVREQREILQMIADARTNPSKRLFRDIEKACNISFSQEIPTEQELLILAEEVIGAYNQGGGSYYTQKDCFVSRENFFISAEAYADSIRMPFENITIPVPIGYDEILRLKYGDDYMTPINTGGGHDYPFYKFFMEPIYHNGSFATKKEADTYIANISGVFYDRFLQKEAFPKLSLQDQDMDELQRVRAAQMEVLYELERICKEERIRIFAVGDTLENTLQYQGYAPEEERMTLGVMREDYQRFLRAIQEKLDVWFDYQSIYSNEAYDRLSILVMTDTYLCEEKEALMRFHGCPYTVGIEVCPTDYVAEDKEKEETRNTLVKSLYAMAQSCLEQDADEEKLYQMAGQWKESMQLNINLEGDLAREFLKAADTYMGMFTAADGHQVKIFGSSLEGIDRSYEAELFEEVQQMPFEQMMMPVPKGFRRELSLEEEVRDGFLVSSMMKRVWAAQLCVLEEVRRVCEILHIPFFADWGTLLGAVRHHGFIPWDDDMDIGMLRQDYMRFLEEAPAILRLPFEIKSVYNDPTDDIIKARIINGRHMSFEKDFLEQFFGCPYVVGIDIFPIDNITEDQKQLEEQIQALQFVLKAAASVPEEPPYGDDVLALLAQIEHTFGFAIDYNNRPAHELKKLYDILCSRYMQEETEEVTSMIDLANGWDYHAKRAWFSEVIEMPFENTTIPVPAGYDGLLRIKYGEDYMTPRQVISHEYPFFKEQMLGLKQVMETEFETQLSEDEMYQMIEMKALGRAY